ncbi:hypothetical protein ACLOJK_041205 [Asimina triloba]
MDRRSINLRFCMEHHAKLRLWYGCSGHAESFYRWYFRWAPCSIKSTLIKNCPQHPREGLEFALL